MICAYVRACVRACVRAWPAHVRAFVCMRLMILTKVRTLVLNQLRALLKLFTHYNYLNYSHTTIT